jgi:hypothetical protein
MKRRDFIKRGALFVPSVFVPRLIRAQANSFRDLPWLGNVTPAAAGGGASNGLLTNLVAYYKLDENVASGTRADSHVNGLNLTDTSANVNSNASGILGRCADMVSNNGGLTHADDSHFQVGGNQDFTWQAWINRLGSTATPCPLIDKGLYSGNGDEYFLDLQSNTPRFCVGSGVSFGLAAWGSTITNSAWHQILGWYDHTGQTVNIQVDNGTPVTVSFTAGTQNTTSQVLALFKNSAAGSFYTKQMDEVGFWKEALSATKRNLLWGGGAGLAFSSFS